MTLPRFALDDDDDDDPFSVPHLTSLCTRIDAFTASLTVAHPALLTRHPSGDREVTALLLHMYLAYCRHLLEEYDRLMFGDAFWRVDGSGNDADDIDDINDIPF